MVTSHNRDKQPIQRLVEAHASCILKQHDFGRLALGNGCEGGVKTVVNPRVYNILFSIYL